MRKILAGYILILCTLLVCSIAFAADNDSAKKHRVGILLGPHFPTGEYKEPGISTLKYETGVTFGVEYSYMHTKNFGFGAFIEGTSFSSENLVLNYLGNRYNVELDVSTIVFGISAVLQHQLANKLKLYGAGKIGVAGNELEIEITRNHSMSTTGRTLAVIFEGGARYPLNDLLDFGVAARYSSINQSIEGGGSTNLGGLSIVGTLGFSF